MSEKTGYINIDSAEIYYELSGNIDGKAILLLHGGLCAIDDLDAVREHIPSDYLVVSVDFRGHGKSTIGEASLNYAQYQKDVEGVLNHLGLTRYSIFGFSDGGTVGYRLAAENPEQVERLITLGSQWRLESGDPSIEMLEGLTPEFWEHRFPEGVERYNTSNPKPDFSGLVEAVKKVWVDTSITGYPKQSVDAIGCPVLIMRGNNDLSFSLDEAMQLIKRIPYSNFGNIPFTGHASYEESPELVGAMIGQFLS